jgi:predicted ATPase/DNA-binding XRE family transcriptional regulator
MSRDAEGVPAFGAWAKQRRLALELTQAALAQSIGCAVATLQKIEQGARTPSEQIAGLLARAFHIPEADIPAVVVAARSGVAPVLRAPRPALTRVDDLIGRDAQLAELAGLLLDDASRVVTLIGPGGVGKTSLALALAHALGAHYASGARVVSLADARTPGLVTGVAASALAPDAGIGTLPALLNVLKVRKQLIVFDNFEHVLPAADIVEQIAAAAPGVQLVITSREALGVRGERIIPVRPLSGKSAHALFVRHAQLADPRWQPTPDDAAVIDALCGAFDNLPLAIRLCAARVVVMPPAVLLQRLLTVQGVPRIELAADGLSDLPRRHHSLDETIRWSYNLLSEPERTAFQRMAVFAGGADLLAAEAVLGGEGGEIEAWNLLTALLQKSLIVRTTPADSDAPRFAPFETLRVFAARQAAREGTWAAIQDDHLRYFAVLAEANEGLTPFNARIAAQARETPNFYAALSYAWRRDPDAGMRLFRALIKFWRARVRFGEQLLMAEQGLAGLPETEHPARGELHMQAGSACIALERIDDAEAHLARAGELLDRDPEAARTLMWRVRDLQGLVAERRGDLDASLALHQAAASMTTQPGEIVRAQMHAGRAAAMSGRFELAEAMLTAVCAALSAEDENVLLASLLLAHSQMMLGKLDTAETVLNRCLAQTASISLYDWTGAMHLALCSVAYLRGDTDEALRAADRARTEFAAISGGFSALPRCDRVRALLLIERGDTAAGLALLRATLLGERFADNSVAGVAVLAGFALGFDQSGRRAAAGVAAARVTHAFAQIDLTRRVFVDASPVELEFARRVSRRLAGVVAPADAPVALNAALAQAMADA